MTRLSACAVLGLVGALTLSLAERSFAEHPQAVASPPKPTQVAAEWNTDVRPPLVEGKPRDCANPPDCADVLRALPTVASGIPWLYEAGRDSFDFAVECLEDRV